MKIIEVKNIVQGHFSTLPYIHYDNKRLKVMGKNYRITPDDTFLSDSEIIVIEYENTKRPVESISKYWWLFYKTDWLRNDLPLKLVFIGLNPEHKEIRRDSVEILGRSLKLNLQIYSAFIIFLGMRLMN